MNDLALNMEIIIAAFGVGLLCTYLLLFALLKNYRDKERRKGQIKLLSILGSGGHTSEMLKMTSVLDEAKYQPRVYLRADTDELSEVKARKQDPDCEVMVIPRAREVGQSWISTVFTTLRSTLASFLVVARVQPDLLLCNGPGTCVPACLMAFALNKLRLTRTKIVFIESICRVKHLSMSGKILKYIVDDLLVLWEELRDAIPGTKYVARFV